MIGSLTGRLQHKQPPNLLIDVGGVGYELEAPMTTFYDLPDTPETVTLHTHLLVREDAQLLFGFSDLRQRELFRSLLKVNGVGPRVALAILSTLSAQEFVNCIASDDSVTLTRVPGIGRKTAERLIVEMRDRIEPHQQSLQASDAVGAVDEQSPVQDAISALVALGYRASDASKAVREVEADHKGRDQLIRNALKRLSGG